MEYMYIYEQRSTVNTLEGKVGERQTFLEEIFCQ